MNHQSTSQKGFAAIAAIFLIVVLAALGGFMLTFSNAQHTTSAQDVQGSKAYWAAMAGLEWGMSSVVSGSANCLPSSNLRIGPFSVVIRCNFRLYTEASTLRTIYQLTSVASLTGGTVGSLSYIERSVSAVIEK